MKNTSVLMAIVLLLTVAKLNAQSVAGSTWDAAAATANAGYINWGSGVISLTDTTTGSGSCQGAVISETGGYNPTTNFSQCFKMFFGCPGNDQIGTAGNPYTDFNGDGMAFTFWKNSATYNINAGTACGGGLGYDNAISDLKAVTIEFDTYSSIGTDNVDPNYGGGGPGSGINDEVAVQINAESRDEGRLTSSNAGNLEDGQEHTVCINYNATTFVLSVTIDGVTRLSYNLGATNNLNSYFAGSTLNYSWSAGKYGANNLQTIGPAGSNLFAVMGRNPCTGVVVMPVRLLSFTGENENEKAVLYWTTVTEMNNEKFIIERSNDLSSWEGIGIVAGAGNSLALVNYSFVDDAMLSGTNYYRLKQVDFDGTSAYSHAITLTGDIDHVSLVPNPFEEVLTIRSSMSGNMNIVIRDIFGRIVYSASKENENGVISIHPGLSPGAYIITMQTDTFMEQRKIVRK
ncbi:MAG: T9SS type A sorting domain-containing protein [Cytophagaceae bacterium]|nr:T9SS type A sorting domain-containing protein [Cytophagaceae bacterium]